MFQQTLYCVLPFKIEKVRQSLWIIYHSRSRRFGSTTYSQDLGGSMMSLFQIKGAVSQSRVSVLFDLAVSGKLPLPSRRLTTHGTGIKGQQLILQDFLGGKIMPILLSIHMVKTLVVAWTEIKLLDSSPNFNTNMMLTHIEP